MSIKSSLLRLAIKLTPDFLIIWIANFVLKGVAQLLVFNFDIDTRRLYVKTQLYGESDTIEVTLEDFVLFNDGDAYRFIIHRGYSDRLWLSNLLNKFVGKAWKIPAIPMLQNQLAIVAELFQAPASVQPALETPDQEA